ncbi:MAG: glycosyltransferase family 1 protein [Pseudomonadota bacterium]
MRIGIDVRTIGKNRTGDETYISNLVINLAKQDKVNEYFLFTDVADISHIELFKTLPETFKVISILPANKLIWTMVLLPMKAHSLKLDILHALYITPLFLPKRTKLVTTIHDVSWQFLPEYIQKKDLFILNTLIPKSIKRADVVLTISENSRKDILKFYPTTKPGKVKTIYIGGSVRSADAPGPFDSSRWGGVEPQNYILYLGTLQPRKNVPSLIEAYIEMHKTFASQFKVFPKLLIVGGRGHNFDTRIDERVAAFAHKELILFPGYVSEKEKQSLIENASMFVYPSLYEGFGIPPLEAMSSSIPCIVSNRSCLPEVVGNGACIVEPDDTAAFAAALFSVMTDMGVRKTLIENGLKKEKEYTWEKMVKQTLEVYKSL